MAKKTKNTQSADDNVIVKTEHHYFNKKYSEKELIKKQKELSDLLMEKFGHEQTIVKAQEALKAMKYKLSTASQVIIDGGEDVNEKCEVKIYRDRMKKEYYYKGELVDTEDAEDEDLQLEIDEQE